MDYIRFNRLWALYYAKKVLPDAAPYWLGVLAVLTGKLHLAVQKYIINHVEEVGMLDPVEYDSASIDKRKFCSDCGWPVVHVCCNGDFLDDISTEKWDWWVYCSNKSCHNHEGNGVFQDTPAWVSQVPQTNTLQTGRQMRQVIAQQIQYFEASTGHKPTLVYVGYLQFDALQYCVPPQMRNPVIEDVQIVKVDAPIHMGFGCNTLMVGATP